MTRAPRSMRPGTIRKIVTLTGPLLAIMSVMLLVSVASVDALSSLRAYVNGESLWSKAEHEASHALRNYASTASRADYSEFEHWLAVPLADRDARVELERPVADQVRAAKFLIVGGNAPSDVAGMVVLFRVGRHLAAFEAPVSCWRAGDLLIQDLKHTGEELLAEMNRPSPDERRISALAARAEEIHRRLQPLEQGFSASLGELSRELKRQLVLILSGLSGALVAIGVAMLTAALRRSERVRGELDEARRLVQQEQERAQVTLGSIADAVITLHTDERVAYMNPAAERLLLCRKEQAVGRGVLDVLRLTEDALNASIVGRLSKVVAGEELNGAAVGVPLHRRDGTEVSLHERAAPIHDADGRVSGIVLVLRDVTQERELAQRLKYQATHDALTGLANRYEFETQLAAALDEHKRSSVRFALLYFDLDQFKVINDTCGHAAGDELIRRVAFLVRAQLRNEDVLGRLGGDEFGALVACGAEEMLALAERIRKELAGLRFYWQGKLFSVSASIGVLALTEELVNVAEALAAVDQACYLAKDGGRNRVQLYSVEDAAVQQRAGELRWVERIHAALDQDRFSLLAQEIRPILPHRGRRKSCAAPRYEILLRLLDAERRPCAPMAFIPAAERFGLMPKIDRWVITHACRELAELRASGASLPVCVLNISGASVGDPDLVDFVRSCLQDNELSGQQLGFELTETAAIGNLPGCAQLMQRLKDLGCQVGLDDFGSGMSSFDYLKSLPVDFVKIDGKFVRNVATDPVDLSIVEAIQRIGRALKISIVAECVEDEGALTALRAIGVDFAQGFHVHRPVMFADLMSELPNAPGAVARGAVERLRDQIGADDAASTALSVKRSSASA